MSPENVAAVINGLHGDHSITAFPGEYVDGCQGAFIRRW